MRTSNLGIRMVLALLLGFVLTLGAPGAPAAPAFAEENNTGEAPQEAAADPANPEDPAAQPEPEPEPPKTYVVNYEPNGGTGVMEPTTFTEGQPATIALCSFVREGYTFEGWSTEPDGGGLRFSDGMNIQSHLAGDIAGYTLYAQWGSQVYLIHYSSGVAKGSRTMAAGSMPVQFAVYDTDVPLAQCGFTRKGYTAKGWMDSVGTFHEFGSVGRDFAEGTSTTSWEVASVSIELARPGDAEHWSCQGSVVFTGEDGDKYGAVTFIRHNEFYTSGSLENYDSEIMVVNLETEELVKHASGIMIEHGNDIAYRPDNGHFYIAQGGMFEGFPNGIVELDENLNEVRTIQPEGTHHIWNLTYSDGVFYAIGNVDADSFARGNPEGTTSDLIRLDQDLNVIDMHPIDFSPKGFTGQGMATDGEALYAILLNTSKVESERKQRLTLFTLDGAARGTQYIDITNEVESASWLDGKMYFSINGGSFTTFFGTELASTTMTAVWKPNSYAIEFDKNGVVARGVPDPVDAEYDQTFSLPTEVPESPGYEFVGWTMEADGSGRLFAPGEQVMNLAEGGTITMYAQWKRPFVPFVADNGSRVHGRRFGRSRRARQPEVADEGAGAKGAEGAAEGAGADAAGADELGTDASTAALTVAAFALVTMRPKASTRRRTAAALA